jgi:hypothetical protein
VAVALREVRSSRADVAWRPRPAASLCLRIAALGAPIAAAFLAATLFARLVPPPDGAALWAWRGLMVLAATAVSMVTERLLRNVVSLSTLLKLSLVFPDHAPPRYSIALRTGTTEQLRKQLLEGDTHDALDVDAQAAATRLLELVSALNAHDRLTRGHSERVRAYARLIGEELELGPDDLAMLSWSALLHDIGKLEVSAETLSAPGKLTDEQWAEIKRHPEAGDRIIAPLREWLGVWGNAVRDHHERWEGGGYPSGTAGRDISLAGRIVAVADAFDVMTSPRSYKKPCSAAAAREELQRCAGTQFDPEIVRAFLNVSIGRLRAVLGPLSFLAELPLLARLPVGTIAANAVPVVTAATLTAGSMLGLGPVPAPHAADASPANAPAAVSPRGGLAFQGGLPLDDQGVPVDTSSDGSSTPAVTPEPVDAGGDDPGQSVVPGVTAPTTTTILNLPGITLPPLPIPPPTSIINATTTTAPTTTTTPSTHTFVANDDSATVLLSGSTVIDVVANDYDQFDHDITIMSVSTPQHGTATIISSGKFGRIRYTSNSLLGADTFTYTIRCEGGEVATATVHVTIIL